jgi:hypothetical protein
MTKKKFEDLSFGAGRYDNSKITASFIECLCKRYGFKASYNLKNKIDDALLNYYAGAPVKKSPTSVQKNGRLSKISSCAKQLDQMLEKLHPDEFWHVQKAIYSRLKEVDGEHFDPLEFSKPADFYDEVQTLRIYLKRLVGNSELGVEEKPLSERGRPSKDVEKETIFRLLTAFSEGTGIKVSLSSKNYLETNKSAAVTFCLDIFNEQDFPERPNGKLSYIFTAQLIWDTAKEFMKIKVAQK